MFPRTILFLSLSLSGVYCRRPFFSARGGFQTPFGISPSVRYDANEDTMPAIAPSSSAVTIMAEQPIVDATTTAEHMIAEAESILSNPSNGWKVHEDTEFLKVESKPVEAGPYAGSKLLVMWASGIICSASAEEVLARVTSPEGFAAISPLADSSRPPLEEFSWGEGEEEENLHRPKQNNALFGSHVVRGGASNMVNRLSRRLEARLTTISMPAFIRDREFVVLNAIDPHRHIFGSKSIIHPSHHPERVRGVTAFYIKTEPISSKVCRVQYVSFVDLGGSMPKGMVNAVNTRSALQDVHKRVVSLMETDSK